MLNLYSQAATTTESMMAKADRDEAERLNAKNSVEEYIYEIRCCCYLTSIMGLKITLLSSQRQNLRRVGGLHAGRRQREVLKGVDGLRRLAL